MAPAPTRRDEPSFHHAQQAWKQRFDRTEYPFGTEPNAYQAAMGIMKLSGQAPKGHS